MIRLTRLRNSNPLWLNPDHIERLDQYHETTIHLFNGDEFIVTESAEEIVALIARQRAGVLALASRLAAEHGTAGTALDIDASGPGSAIVALVGDPGEREG